MFFRFKTMTEQDYFFIFTIEVVSDGTIYNIIQTPHVERLMPWEESDQRNRLKSELDPIIEKSKDKPMDAKIYEDS